MKISSQALLNILIPNDNKVLKEALKEADNKSLSQNKNASNVQDILKNLVSSVQSKEKSNQTVHNLLKNASVFKNMGNFTQQLNTLINNLPQGEKFSNFKAVLQSLQTNISQIDDTNLKENILKSGVFLESKLAKGQSNEILNKVNTILEQIKTLISKETSPKAQQLNGLMDKLSAQINTARPNLNQVQGNLKEIMSSLKDIIQNKTGQNEQKIVQLSHKLEELGQNHKLIQSKLENFNTTTLPKTHPLNTNTTQPNPAINETKIVVQKAEEQNTRILQDSKQVLTQLKTELLQTKNPIFVPILKNIDTLIKNAQQQLTQPLTQTSSVSNQTPLEPLKILQSLLKMPDIQRASQENPKIESAIKQLLNVQDNIQKNQESLVQNKPIVSDITQTIGTLKQNVSMLISQLSSAQNSTTNNIVLVLEKLLQSNNLFSKIDLPLELKEFLQTQSPNLFSKENTSFSSNINQLILSLKSALTQINPSSNDSAFYNIKSVEKLEQIVQSVMQNTQQNSIKQGNLTLDTFQNDVKSTLLQLKEDLGQTSQFKEQFKTVERLLTHIDYHQLLSATSNSNFVYLPFIWDMLDEGQISMKKTDTERYFCEIHLTLKEFGKMDMYLSLYDKNSLDISIATDRDFVKEMIKEHMVTLKQGLNKIDLVARNIKILDLKEELPKEEKSIQNTYSVLNNEELNFGLDIKV